MIIYVKSNIPSSQINEKNVIVELNYKNCWCWLMNWKKKLSTEDRNKAADIFKKSIPNATKKNNRNKISPFIGGWQKGLWFGNLCPVCAIYL